METDMQRLPPNYEVAREMGNLVKKLRRSDIMTE